MYVKYYGKHFVKYVNPLTPQGRGLFCPSFKKEQKTTLKHGFKGLKCSAKLFSVKFYYKSLNTPKRKI